MLFQHFHFKNDHFQSLFIWNHLHFSHLEYYFTSKHDFYTINHLQYLERHYQNRLFNELFVRSIHKTLTINGCFHIKTDHQNYFKDIYNTLSMNRKFGKIKSFSLKENEKTDFERLFYNKKIYSCSFTKLVD